MGTIPKLNRLSHYNRKPGDRHSIQDLWRKRLNHLLKIF
jgi:hypothetical protein